MSYSITGVRRFPDVGFKSASRQTAEGAREVALMFLSDGMREVEIHDAEGNLRTLRDLERITKDLCGVEPMVATRLARL